MGSVSTSVGCAVGIPIGVGIIIAFAFWYRLQRRFKKELEDDKDLEHEIYDDTAYISFNHLDSLKKDTQQNNNNNNSNNNNNLDITLDDNNNNNNSIIHDHNNNNTTKNRPKNNMYIPAYRRKINSLRHQSIRMINNKNSSNNLYSTNIESENTINSPPPILSRSSLKSSSLQNIHDPQQQQVRQISTYDQMVPLVNPSLIFDSKNNMNDHISFQSDSTYKNDSFNIRSLQYQDLGSYYPAVPNSTNNSIQNYKFNLSTSSLNNSTNIFSTPNSKKNHVNTIHANEDNSRIMDSTQNDVELDYILKNNYDINDSESKIVEEDQYENEFTNYKENRRQFLNSLRPTNIE